MLKRLIARVLTRKTEPKAEPADEAETFHFKPTIEDLVRVSWEMHEHHMENILRDGTVRVSGWQNCVPGTVAYAAQQLAFDGLMECKLLPNSGHMGGVWEYRITPKGRAKQAA